MLVKPTSIKLAATELSSALNFSQNVPQPISYQHVENSTRIYFALYLLGNSIDIDFNSSTDIAMANYCYKIINQLSIKL